jgi:hypothetical protein
MNLNRSDLILKLIINNLMAKNAAKLVNATKIPELFPPVQFAFYGNTITRYR